MTPEDRAANIGRLMLGEQPSDEVINVLSSEIRKAVSQVIERDPGVSEEQARDLASAELHDRMMLFMQLDEAVR